MQKLVELSIVMTILVCCLKAIQGEHFLIALRYRVEAYTRVTLIVHSQEMHHVVLFYNNTARHDGVAVHLFSNVHILFSEKCTVAFRSNTALQHGGALYSFDNIVVHTYGYRYMKNSKEKIPNRLADFCKRSSVNQMAAGSRLPRSSHGIFSPFY